MRQFILMLGLTVIGVAVAFLLLARPPGDDSRQGDLGASVAQCQRAAVLSPSAGALTRELLSCAADWEGAFLWHVRVLNQGGRGKVVGTKAVEGLPEDTHACIQKLEAVALSAEPVSELNLQEIVSLEVVRPQGGGQVAAHGSALCASISEVAHFAQVVEPMGSLGIPGAQGVVQHLQQCDQAQVEPDRNVAEVFRVAYRRVGSDVEACDLRLSSGRSRYEACLCAGLAKWEGLGKRVPVPEGRTEEVSRWLIREPWAGGVRFFQMERLSP